MNTSKTIIKKRFSLPSWQSENRERPLLNPSQLVTSPNQALHFTCAHNPQERDGDRAGVARAGALASE